MKVDKRIFPYVLAVGSLLLPTCQKHRDTVPQQAVVTGIRHAIVYLDTNNDGRCDKTTCFVEEDDNDAENCSIIRNNIKAGDVLKFRADRKDIDKQHSVILYYLLDSVNGMSRDSFLAFCNAKELQQKSKKSVEEPMVLDYVLTGDTIEVFLRKKEKLVNDTNQVFTQVRRIQEQKIK
jgi:hypothetical protein